MYACAFCLASRLQSIAFFYSYEGHDIGILSFVAVSLYLIYPKNYVANQPGQVILGNYVVWHGVERWEHECLVSCFGLISPKIAYVE